MAKKKKNSRVRVYRHDEKRKNNPPIGMVNYVLALFALRFAPCSLPHVYPACPVGRNYRTGVESATIPLGPFSISLGRHAFRPLLYALCAMRYALCPLPSFP